MESDAKKNIKPFVKWAGGKRQFIKELSELIPDDFNTYIEPFVGGGTLFFHLLKEDKIKNYAIINDLNKELMFTYKIIKDNRNLLIKHLNKHVENSSKEYFLKLRKEIVDFRKPAKVASRFIYLNKSGFNGLYRVNLSGIFNVPFGKSNTPNFSVYNHENLVDCSNAMNNIHLQIRWTDYKKIIPKSGDFVFIDPPYHSETKTFTSYTKQGFSDKEQIELSDWINELNKKGVRFLFTNHNTKLIRDLYLKNPDFKSKIYHANRFINPNGNNRKKVAEEIFIYNY